MSHLFRMIFFTTPLLLTLISLLICSAAYAQTGEAIDPANAYDLNLNFGTLLPSRFGVTEMVPGWGLRVSVPTDKGVFEIGGYSGIGNGAIYRSLTLDYRVDVHSASINAHVNFGLHGDQYDFSAPPTDDNPDGARAASQFTGGWHYGGGLTQWLGGPLYFRGDFRHRFGPGQSVEITLGFTYRLSSEGGSR